MASGAASMAEGQRTCAARKADSGMCAGWRLFRRFPIRRIGSCFFPATGKGAQCMSFNSTIFVVDDDAAARASVVAIVEAQGGKAEAFESAEAFLQAYDGRPGCVIADLRMPG